MTVTAYKANATPQHTTSQETSMKLTSNSIRTAAFREYAEKYREYGYKDPHWNKQFNMRLCFVDEVAKCIPDGLWHGSTTQLEPGTVLRKGHDTTLNTFEVGAWATTDTVEASFYFNDEVGYLHRVVPSDDAEYVETEHGRCYHKGTLTVAEVVSAPNAPNIFDDAFYNEYTPSPPKKRRRRRRR